MQCITKTSWFSILITKYTGAVVTGKWNFVKIGTVSSSLETTIDVYINIFLFFFHDGYIAAQDTAIRMSFC